MASSAARSVLSVLAGWGVVGVLVVTTDGVLAKLFPAEYVIGRMPPDYLVGISLATSTVWSVAGGWVTARLAPGRPWHHIVGLVIWGELLGIASSVMTWGQIQMWYQLGLLGLWMPAVVLGGWLRAGKPASIRAGAA
ncbi:hypothetical protein [uncultured Paludibaculum sp.]|uniref:hypothetical protein n=1 Tax=uncultured Paludibaculum sp. TaxID=1765020 RepID=UPI002AABDCDA|nr:hypothetical protein [uncultured Paludibaculum sp.]